MTRHTSGEWFYEDSETGGEAYTITVARPECQSLHVGSLTTVPEPLWDEQEANARLITAASRLLTACKVAFVSLSTLMEQAGESADSDAVEWQKGGEHYTAMQAVIGAIAQADEDSAKFIVESVSE